MRCQSAGECAALASGVAVILNSKAALEGDATLLFGFAGGPSLRWLSPSVDNIQPTQPAVPAKKTTVAMARSKSKGVHACHAKRLRIYDVLRATAATTPTPSASTTFGASWCVEFGDHGAAWLPTHPLLDAKSPQVCAGWTILELQMGIARWGHIAGVGVPHSQVVSAAKQRSGGLYDDGVLGSGECARRTDAPRWRRGWVGMRGADDVRAGCRGG